MTEKTLAAHAPAELTSVQVTGKHPDVVAPTAGSCHCGAVHWEFKGLPDFAKACNCTVCRRYGVLWAYGHENAGIQVTGPTRAYCRGDSIEFHFCPECGCVAFWRARESGADGRRRMAVNLRLSEPAGIARIPVLHFDGLQTYQNLPDDGRCIADLWF